MRNEVVSWQVQDDLKRSLRAWERYQWRRRAYFDNVCQLTLITFERIQFTAKENLSQVVNEKSPADVIVIDRWQKYAGLMLSILENSFIENGKLRWIIRLLAPIVSNGRHCNLFFAQQAGICEQQARWIIGTQAQPTVYAQSTLESKPGAIRNWIQEYCWESKSQSWSLYEPLRRLEPKFFAG